MGPAAAHVVTSWRSPRSAPPPTPSRWWRRSARSTSGSSGRHRTAARTPPRTRTCSGGCTWPRSTASWPPTSGTAPPRSTRRAATATSRRPPGSRRRWGCPTRPAARPTCAPSWPPTARSWRAPRPPAKTARFLLLHPPLPLLARAPYGVLAASAVALMPLWARRQLRLPHLPVTERVLVQDLRRRVTRTIRWAMLAPRLR